MLPIGGSELQEKLLYKYVDNTLLGEFEITISVPEKNLYQMTKLIFFGFKILTINLI
jgi:hypothetical protein